MCEEALCPYRQDLAGQYFPHTDQANEKYLFMANTFQMWKMLQENFIDPIDGYVTTKSP